MEPCPNCDGTLCDEHVNRDVETLRGVARSRGMAWAQDVAREIGRREAPAVWPPFEGKCARLARLKVSNLSKDERVLEQLARECHGDAARFWERRPR